MADPRHPHEFTPKAWCAVCLTPIAVDRSFCAIHAPTDLSDWDHYAEEPVDSGMSAKSVERAEFLWASLPVTRKWTSLATHEKALVCHLLDRELAANKAKLELGPCPICTGDCASANPPVMFCPMQEIRRLEAKLEAAEGMAEALSNIDADHPIIFPKDEPSRVPTDAECFAYCRRQARAALANWEKANDR